TAPAERCEDANCAEPAHHIVANRDDRRRFGFLGRHFYTEQSRHGRTDFIEPRTFLPRSRGVVQKDAGMDQPRLLGAKLVLLWQSSISAPRSILILRHPYALKLW